MLILFTSLPGYGHLGPLVPLAVALRSAGHDVRVATSETFREFIESHGLGFQPVGPHWRESDFGRHFQQPNLLQDFARFIETDVTQKVIADLQACVDRDRPDVMLSNDYEPNGRVIAEREGIPFALVSSGPRVSRAFRERLQGAILRASRRAGGLTEEGALDYSLRWLHLCFSPPDHALGDESEGNAFAIRPAVAEFGSGFEPGSHAAGTSSGPTALCTFGTVFNKDAEMLRTVIGAVALRVRTLFVLLGPGIDAADLEPLPLNVELHTDKMLSSILPHVDFVVTHGGTASLNAIQLHGKPCLLLPLGADQILNAAACRRAGLAVTRFHTLAGITVGAEPIVPMTASSVAEAFDELTASDLYRTRAHEFQRTLEALPPLSRAVELLERLALTRAPVHAAP